MTNRRDSTLSSSSPPSKKSFVIPAPSEPGKIELYSPALLRRVYRRRYHELWSHSHGRYPSRSRQVQYAGPFPYIDPAKYKSISSGFGVLLKEQGVRGFFRGWVPTLLGYSAQGACKFGFYEFFKKYYSDIAGPEFACQTQPGFARGLGDGLPKFVKSEGVLGLYKGIVPLWGRQIPYTMMKFASFETIVELMYKYAIPTPKDQCSKSLQLGVSLAGGYVAGVFCAIVSHPADNLVSFLNNAKGATVGDAVKKMGVWGLFTRGLPLRIVMIGTLTGAQWGIYDAFKVFVGLPTTGGVTPAAATLPAKA
ncbi:hypothetical protein F0562_024449 [Nyssa sinensis]|uniref:Uncharacterized protein n=1 Tax=Nyssa sinensis TaxID=561372 RepID=A0A5J5BFN3_9ASTE|nr:hypothetical protein F0562_024449 [Nyssa sinensis]